MFVVVYHAVDVYMCCTIQSVFEGRDCRGQQLVLVLVLVLVPAALPVRPVDF